MSITSDFPVLEHYSDLSEQMNALGLPSSFNSSKRMANSKSKSKKKSNRVANATQSYTDDVFEAESTAQSTRLSKISTHISDDVLEDDTNTVSSESQESISQFIVKFASWEVYWNFEYMKIYYYNVKTSNSTWYPPPEIKSPQYLEDDNTPSVESKFSLLTKGLFASTPTIQLGNLGRVLKLHGSQKAETVTLSLSFSCVQEKDGFTFEEVVDTDPTNDSNKKSRRRIRHRRTIKTAIEICSLGTKSEETANKCIHDITKYWRQRYILFSRFDEGITMDEEGWFSVTPEVIAAHHAIRCAGGSIVDCFAGVGGNSIQFALTGSHVTAIDIDPQKIKCAENNATIYGCASNINFIEGDFFLLAGGLKADKVFLSPPWGGPSYVDVETYDLDMLKPYNGKVLFDIAKEIAPVVVMFLPRTTNVYQLAELASPHWVLEVEMNYLNGRLKAITAYFIKESELGVV